MLFEFLFRFLFYLRNNSTYELYQSLKKYEKLTYSELVEIQNESFKAYASFLAKNNPYYRQIINKLGKNLSDLTVQDLKNFPVTLKSDLLNRPELYDNSIYFKKTFNCETSGTSGQVLIFKRNEEWDSFNRATMMRGYSWHGVKYSDFNIYFWGYSFDFFKRLKARIVDFFLNRYRIFSYSNVAIESLLKKISRAKYISGYSSMIYQLACLAEGKVDKSKLRIKMIKGTSEKIYPHYSDQTLKTFGLPIVSEYGAAETGIIAFACKEGNMHINMEGVVVEVQEDGEILVTNLYSKSFAVVRYQLGDVVRLAPPDYMCTCGLSHPVLLEVTGRIGKRILGSVESYPSLVLYYIFKNLYFGHNLKLNYQAHQNSRGVLDIWLSESVTIEEKELIFKEAVKYFQDDMKLNVFENKSLLQEKGKLKDFITTLN